MFPSAGLSFGGPCLFQVSPAASPTLTRIPLPELKGVYTNNVQKTACFNSGLEFTNINGAAIELTGFHSQGLLMNVGNGQLETIDWHIKATSPLTPAAWSTGDIQSWWEGYFTETSPFYPLSPESSWDFMLDGTVEVQLKMPAYAIILIYTEVKPVSYNICDAHLLVYADCNSIDLAQPNAREYLLAGSTHRIEWNDCRYDYDDISSYGNYLLSFSIDNGQTWEPINQQPVSGTNYYNWQVPDVSAEYCLVRIEDADSTLSDTSDTPFAIYECSDPPAFDLNGDCYLNLLDYALLAAQWQESGGYNLSDLVGLVENWLNCRNASDPECSL